MTPAIQIEQIPYYLTWRIRHEVMYPERSVEFVKLTKDPEGLHFGLYAESRLTSVVSLFAEQGNQIQLRKFATIHAMQGQGFGTLLLKYVIDFSRSQGAKQIWCNARVNVVKFYEGFGFTRTVNTFHKGGYDFVVMERVL